MTVPLIQKAPRMNAHVAHPTERAGASVVLREVSMRFGDKTVLDDVDLVVEAGQFVALVGPSGAGKSTLLRLINGSHRPTGGSLSVLGVDPATCGRRALQRLRTRVRRARVS